MTPEQMKLIEAVAARMNEVEALSKSYTIDRYASGCWIAYKGDRYASTTLDKIRTDTEDALIEMLVMTLATIPYLTRNQSSMVDELEKIVPGFRRDVKSCLDSIDTAEAELQKSMPVLWRLVLAEERSISSVCPS